MYHDLARFVRLINLIFSSFTKLAMLVFLYYLNLENKVDIYNYQSHIS